MGLVVHLLDLDQLAWTSFLIDALVNPRLLRTAYVNTLDSVCIPLLSASVDCREDEKKNMISQFAVDWRRNFAHPSDSWNSTFSIPAVRIKTAK